MPWPFQNVEQAYRDVCLVWSNCREYNFEDREVCDMCDNVAEYFELLWASAGLPKFGKNVREDVSPELLAALSPAASDEAGDGSNGVEKLPEGYSMLTESEQLPLRLLNAFTVYSAADPQHIIALHDMKPWGEAGAVELAVRGKAVRFDPASDPEPIDLEIPLITDWCIEYSSPPAIWVLSPHAWWACRVCMKFSIHVNTSNHLILTVLSVSLWWVAVSGLRYKLEDPSPEYQEEHKVTLLKAELVSQVGIAGMRGTQPKSLAEREELQRDAKFLIPQLKVWQVPCPGIGDLACS
jgi:hypothetical protein